MVFPAQEEFQTLEVVFLLIAEVREKNVENCVILYVRYFRPGEPEGKIL